MNLKGSKDSQNSTLNNKSNNYQPTTSKLMDIGLLFRRRFTMTRGNQREKDRERAQARNAKNKTKDDGLTPEQRRERDAKALQEKAAKKAAQAAGGSDAGGIILG
ncbi:SERF-like protein [Salvia divinorum]|uniref:SERF-like protein n=1 Tax=Salvia divinorum TaxID=28513 RepID=A0ABD1GW73_SALDI